MGLGSGPALSSPFVCKKEDSYQSKHFDEENNFRAILA